MAATVPLLETEGELRFALTTILTTLDNNERRNAEIAVVKSLSLPNTAFLLIAILRDALSGQTSAGVRQLAAILLRKKLFTLWRGLTLPQQAELKQILLQQLGIEPVKLVRFALAHVVSVLAKAEAREATGWPELQMAIRSAMESPAVEFRELSMVLAYSIAEVFGDSADAINEVGDAVVAGLKDSALPVRLAALKAVSVILPMLHGNKSAKTKMYEATIPILIETIQANVGGSEVVQPLVLRCLELVEQLCEDLHTNTHTAYLMQLYELLRGVMVTRTTSDAAGSSGAPVHLRAREHASEVLALLVQTKPKFITKQNLIDSMVQACLTVMAEDDSISVPFEFEEGEDEMDDEDAELLRVRTPCMFSAKLLNICATQLSSKTVTTVTMGYVNQVLENPQSGPLSRKAAVIALACLAEGNPGYLRRRVSYLLQLVQGMLASEHPAPREAAAFSLMYFCDHLQPEILSHHSSLVPMLTQMLHDPHDNVRRRVADTLDRLCENVSENLEPYIPDLMPTLIAAIPSSSVPTQESLVSAMSSIAQTQCPGFANFAESCLTMLQDPMNMTEPQTVLLRAKATEAIGIIAVAIGKARFQPFFDFYMTRITENLQTTRAELKEQSFGFLSNMCELLQEEFAPYVDATLQYAIASLKQDNAHYENKHLLAQAANIRLGVDDEEGGNEDEEDEEHDDDDAEEIHMRVRTADVEEKSSAVYCIGVVASILKVEGIGKERLVTCWKLLKEESSHYHANIRSNVNETLTKLVIAAQGATAFDKGTPGVVQTQDHLHPEVRALIQELLYEVLYPCMAGETDKEVVASACDALGSLLEYFGEQTFDQDYADLCVVLSSLLRQEAPCQSNDEDMVDEDGDVDYEHPAELDDDHDHVLMEAVCDCVDGLARAFGPLFAPHFATLAPNLLPYLSEGRPAEDFTMAAGVLGNCLNDMREAAAPYFDDTLALVLRILSETDESAAKANCCFTIKALVSHCSDRFAQDPTKLREVLTALWGVAGSNEEIPEAIDNAVSATCMFVKRLPQFAPLDSILPALLPHIPMKIDKLENENVISTVGFLLQELPDVATKHLHVVLECCAKVFLSRSVEERLKQNLVQSLRQFGSTRQDVVMPAVQRLNASFINALRQRIGF